MRLLNAETLEIEDFTDTRTQPRYAILSHTWGEEEVSFQDITSDKEGARTKKGFAKISSTCRQARIDGYDYVWIDTCCIDKKSSAELTEAINSMFVWYSNARICYVYLQDVENTPLSGEGYLTAAERSRTDDPLQAPNLGDGTSEHLDSLNQRLSERFPGDASDIAVKFGDSRWFTRGWTLQELIAPSAVAFYNRRWRLLGSLDELIDQVSMVTGIPIIVLNKAIQLKEISIAKRMSWASARNTTRIEDEAYCLLGIFGINMPLLYGEGKSAFIRLQKEIIQTSRDHSIFVWWHQSSHNGHDENAAGEDGQGLHDPMYLACSPSDFANSGTIVPLPRVQATTPHTVSSRGLEITLRTANQTVDFNAMVAYLECLDESRPSHPITILLRPVDSRRLSQATEFAMRKCLPRGRLGDKSTRRRRITIVNRLEHAPGSTFNLDIQFFLSALAAEQLHTEGSLPPIEIVDVHPPEAWNSNRVLCRWSHSWLDYTLYGLRPYFFAFTIEFTMVGRTQSTRSTVVFCCDQNDLIRGTVLNTPAHLSLRDVCDSVQYAELSMVEGRKWTLGDQLRLTYYRMVSSPRNPYDTLALDIQSLSDPSILSVARSIELPYSAMTTGWRLGSFIYETIFKVDPDTWLNERPYGRIVSGELGVPGEPDDKTLHVRHRWTLETMRKKAERPHSFRTVWRARGDWRALHQSAPSRTSLEAYDNAEGGGKDAKAGTCRSDDA